jgi:glycosyltransferase involved in cell wall biosynthesis
VTIDLVFPVLPPTLDGIGDHTAHLAQALSGQGCEVRVLTAQADWQPLSGVQVQQAFSLNRRRGVMNVVDAIRTDPPDWVLLQFEQISYGRWGLNPYVPLAVRRLRTTTPETRIAVMFHEDFMPASSVKFAVMTTWQRLQFWGLGRMADAALFSTETKARRYEDWFPDTPVHHLPVGSNIPAVDAEPPRERERLEIPPDDLVLGLFGSAHPSRLLSHVNAAAVACSRSRADCRVLYIGPDGDDVRGALDSGIPLRDLGPLPAEDASRCFAAMDLYLAPFREGVSTRRGSFLTGLEHGIPTVSTCGPETGELLRRRNGTAYRLAPWSNRDTFASDVVDLLHDPETRKGMSRAARAFYHSNFEWSEISRRLQRVLPECENRSSMPA